MIVPTFRSVLALLVATLVLCACNRQAQPENDVQESKEEETMLIQYLEVVTPDVEQTCSALEKLHGVSFGMPDAGLGNARTATLNVQLGPLGTG